MGLEKLNKKPQRTQSTYGESVSDLYLSQLEASEFSHALWFAVILENEAFCRGAADRAHLQS
jgi:hypothetical protein